jgi:hypothetical protein
MKERAGYKTLRGDCVALLQIGHPGQQDDLGTDAALREHSEVVDIALFTPFLRMLVPVILYTYSPEDT